MAANDKIGEEMFALSLGGYAAYNLLVWQMNDS
jgi:hypothetical protein